MSLIDPLINPPSTLADEHVQELTASAITSEVITDQRVHTARTADELPTWARWIHEAHGEAVLPALVFPMTHPDESVTGQVKPAPNSVTNADGHVLKYISPTREGTPPKLPVLREVDDPEKVLVVEGVKQALAVLSWAPETWSIYRITGIWSWSVAGDGEDEPSSPTPLLSVVQGRDVVIIPDADAKTNVAVYDGAAALGDACTVYGATSVSFVRLPGAGKDGADDLLARFDEGQRTEVLTSWVSGAMKKPADLDQRTLARMRSERRKERAKKSAEKTVDGLSGAMIDGRRGVHMSGDEHQESTDLMAALKNERGGRTLFRIGGSMVRLRRDDEGRLSATRLEGGALRREILDVTFPFSLTKDGVEMPARASKEVLAMVADHCPELPALSGISRSPIVRPDGTILAVDGYDEDTRLYLDLSDDVRGIDVPEHPTDVDLVAAVRLLRDDLFALDGVGGFDGWVFAGVADQTNALAALLTPLVRAMTGPAPMMLFDGIQPGVGKTEAVETISQVIFGTSVSVQSTPSSDEEMDKRITSALLAGDTFIALDEVQDLKSSDCRLESAALRAVLTSYRYASRRLGVSEMLRLPNLATWCGLGNNVQIPADMARRVVPIRLSSDRADLENRDNFRHSLGTWVPEHRQELLRACLTLVRAWFDRGQPEAPRSFGFATFTEWQRVLGGIAHLAGLEGFLDNVLDVRTASDSEAIDNAEHWAWLEEMFPAGTRFRAADVLAQAKADPDAPPPYGKTWDELDARQLSAYYGQHRRWYSDRRVYEDGRVHNSKSYVIELLDPAVTALPAPSSPPALAAGDDEERSAAGAAPGEVIEYVDRDGRAQRVARAMPAMTGKTITEIARDRKDAS